MLKKTLVPLMAMLLLAWAVGCSDNPTTAKGDTVNLTDEFGGYTATDEAPAFGDTELLEAVGRETEIDDPILVSAEVRAMTDDLAAGAFHFRAVWGQIPGDTTVTEVTDWTGSLTLTRGALVVKRLIRFELNQDYYLPRTDRLLVEWVSLTTIHNDGMAVNVYVPPAPLEVDTTWIVDGTDSTMVLDTLAAEPVTLTFETGPYTRTFTLDELASLNELVELDDGTEIAFHSLQFFRRNLCPRGVLSGNWGYDEEGNGVFQGAWFSGFGHVTGYLNGHFGVNDEGENVFYGKWIDLVGVFEGLIRGTWGKKALSSDNPEANRHRHAGWFAGLVYDADGNQIGGMGGHYGAAPAFRDGWFQGRWKLRCVLPPDDSDGNLYRNDGIPDGPVM